MANQKPSIKVLEAELRVKNKFWITPHYIRVTLTGDDVTRFAHTTPGANNKIFIPPSGVDKIYFPDFDFEKMQWTHPPEDVRPVIRTYTHRGFDAVNNEMYIDFVVHVDTIESTSLPEPGLSKFAYVAAEFSTVKALRNYFRKEKNWTKEELYAYSYWKAGHSEDRSQIERHKENEEV